MKTTLSIDGTVIKSSNPSGSIDAKLTIPVSQYSHQATIRVRVRVDLENDDIVRTVEYRDRVVYQPTPPEPADAIEVILKAINDSDDKAEAVRFWLTEVTNQLTAVMRVSETREEQS